MRIRPPQPPRPDTGGNASAAPAPPGPLLSGRAGRAVALVMGVLFAGMVSLWLAPATGPAGLLHPLWFTSG
ncbi:hypothetical protein, partial [Actinomyces qiguomingii]|uniref:hypothetical protein n=1 Tax=Actinomyces qiguomingii TaxID=2057800 RepID=UPI001E46DF2D